MESKLFELVVGDVSTVLRIHEICRGVTHSIVLGRSDSFWFLDSFEEALLVKNALVFWRRSQAGFLVFLFSSVLTSMAVFWLRKTMGVEEGGGLF